MRRREEELVLKWRFRALEMVKRAREEVERENADSIFRERKEGDGFCYLSICFFPVRLPAFQFSIVAQHCQTKRIVSLAIVFIGNLLLFFIGSFYRK